MAVYPYSRARVRPVPPDPFYYLANFRRALAWLALRSADLFDDAERAFVAQFDQVPRAAQALLVRMLMRRGPHFRTSRLQYDEIGCPREAAAPLVALGWLEADVSLELDELAALVVKAELVPLAARSGIAHDPRGTRAQVLAALRAGQLAARRYSEWRPDADDAVLQLSIAPLCERLRLMFFGNLHQDWSEFVLADLGVYRYETVEFDALSRAFAQRADIDGYLALQACRNALDADTDVAPIATVLDALDELAPRLQGNPWLTRRAAKVRYEAGQRAERAGNPELAARAYLASTHREARYRRVRVLEQLGERDAALALARDIAAAPAHEEEAQRVARTLARLEQRRGGTRRRAPLAWPVREIVLPPTSATLRVEEAVRVALTSDDAPVFYVENTLVTALFGLLCWPALFAPLPGAFFHPFQRGPADLHADDFVVRRAALFEACLAELDSDAYRTTILQRFEDKLGTQSPFVSWGALTPELLQLALDCMSAAHLRLWFRRLLDDLPTNRSGLPDLVRFWPREQRYELIEVKGPGDRLQDNQLRWLAWCASHDLPVAVLHARWAGTEVEDADSGP